VKRKRESGRQRGELGWCVVFYWRREDQRHFADIDNEETIKGNAACFALRTRFAFLFPTNGKKDGKGATPQDIELIKHNQLFELISPIKRQRCSLPLPKWPFSNQQLSFICI
jgi:hypothetical protein